MSIGWMRLPDSVVREWREPPPVMMWPEPFVFSIMNEHGQRIFDNVPPEVALCFVSTFNAECDQATDRFPLDAGRRSPIKRPGTPMLMIRERPQAQAVDPARSQKLFESAKSASSTEPRRPWWRWWRPG